MEKGQVRERRRGEGEHGMRKRDKGAEGKRSEGGEWKIAEGGNGQGR